MKPPKFHAGQAVVCTEEWNGLSEDGRTPVPANRPEIGPVYKVQQVAWDGESGHCLQIVGLPFWWDESAFAPAEYLSSEALAALLEETLEPVTA